MQFIFAGRIILVGGKMAEIINLEEWKKQKEMKEVAQLEQELDAWIEYLGIEQKYYIFDDDYNPIEIKIRSN